MSVNLINDPGAELGTDDWALTGLAERASDYGCHGGSWAWLLAGINALGIRTGSTLTQGSLTLTPGEEYALSAWVDPTLRGTKAVQAQYDPGDGSYVAVNCGETGSEWVEWEIATFTASGSVGSVRFALSAPSSSGGSYWIVDDVTLASTAEASMAAKIRTIKAAIATYLRTITTDAGYQVTIGDVHECEVGIQALGTTPAAELLALGEEKTLDGAALSRKRGRAAFLLQLWADGDSAESTLWDLSSDIEKCLETPTAAAMLGLSYVDEIAVVSKYLFETTESIARGLRMLELVVEVQYTHARNAA